MKDKRGLAMHGLRRMDNFSAERLPYALMTEADTQQGNLLIVALDQGYRYTRFTRRARAWGNHNPLRL
jgi:hypothetical protein